MRNSLSIACIIVFVMISTIFNGKTVLSTITCKETKDLAHSCLPIVKSKRGCCEGIWSMNTEAKESTQIRRDLCTCFQEAIQKNPFQSFFKKGFLPNGVNATILALIPKKEEARMMNDYRPISLCNMLYKMISKIIANHLKCILQKFIGLIQSVENVLLATELVKNYHKDSMSLRCAMKIDISKAFNSVQWSFLLNTLSALNFPAKLIHLIRLCISMASFSVQVNGELSGFFKSERGMLQGCAISLYLFIICMNVLSKFIDKVEMDRRIGYHLKCKIINLTHLRFADDLMAFVDGHKRFIEGIIKIFDEFALTSGVKISFEKSTLYLAVISDQNHEDIGLAQYPFTMGQLLVRYLGLPLLTKRIIVADSTSLLEKIRARIRSWTARYLSYEGSLQLLKSVLACNTMVVLWVKWLKCTRLRKNTFLEVQDCPNMGSWIWRRLLKYHNVAKPLHKVEVQNGLSTSFRFNNWSTLGRLGDIAGARGSIISSRTTVASVMISHRSRSHQVEMLNCIEDEIQNVRQNKQNGDYVWLWLFAEDKFKKKMTWEHNQRCQAENQQVQRN